MAAPTLSDYEEVFALFAQLMPAAADRAREYVLSHTPSQYLQLMSRLVNATPLLAASDVIGYQTVMPPLQIGVTPGSTSSPQATGGAPASPPSSRPPPSSSA